MTDGSSWLADFDADLQAALEAADSSEKNHHIRAALQKVTVQRGDGE